MLIFLGGKVSDKSMGECGGGGGDCPKSFHGISDKVMNLNLEVQIKLPDLPHRFSRLYPDHFRMVPYKFDCVLSYFSNHFMSFGSFTFWVRNTSNIFDGRP